ncbi:hypothetical protein XELAEV_18046669mg [Xenopus laevis]|uniref:Uncharacterized protein n=1 Tax=Xenopus laevis TaxID=8355 RepID=A0A974H0T3_XENLA|nr:hypothetical protein XELAEV_18046669mg [Xenopus laevis]
MSVCEKGRPKKYGTINMSTVQLLGEFCILLHSIGPQVACRSRLLQTEGWSEEECRVYRVAYGCSCVYHHILGVRGGTAGEMAV